MSTDIESAAHVELEEALADERGTLDELTSQIEDVEDNFDFDSFAPYTSEEDEILSDYESDYASDAEGFLSDEKQYSASDWAAAKRSYVAAIAYAAFSSILNQAKQQLIEALDDFNAEAEQLMDDAPIITVSHSCIHGWASHDREDRWDGTHYWEHGQLDGSNGMAIKVGELWLSVCYTPKPEEPEVDDDKENELRERI